MTHNFERELRRHAVLTYAAALTLVVSARWLDVTAMRFDDPASLWALAGLTTACITLWLVVRVGRTRARREMAMRVDAQRAAEQGERLTNLTAALGRARSEAAVLEAS